MRSPDRGYTEATLSRESVFASGGQGMSHIATSATPNRRIDSWKEIAAFFGRDERTVKRWEKERGLPVRRVPGNRGSVFAYTDELSRWLHSSKSQPPGRLATEPAKGSKLAPVPSAVETIQISGRPGRKAPLWPAGVAVAVAALAIPVGLARYNHHQAVSQPQPRAQAAHTPDPVAREFYLKGRYEWNQRTDRSLVQAVDAFTQAVVHDPGYAEAYAGLAECYDVMPEFSAMPPSEAFPRAIAAARRAIALNDSLAEAHRALAFGLFYWEWKVPQALSEYQRALALDPRDDEAHHWYATSLMTLGTRPKDSLAEIDTARQLNPASRSILADQAIIRFENGDAAGAKTQLREIEQSEQDFASAPRYLAQIAWSTGDDREWISQTRRLATLLKDPATRAEAAAAGNGLATGGHRAMLEALRAVQQRELNCGRPAGFDLAQTDARLGLRPESVAALRTAFTSHDFRVIGLESNPVFASLRGDPAFAELQREIRERTAGRS